MLFNLSKDGCILSKDNFDVSHPLDHGSLYRSEGLGCNRKIAYSGHDYKKILSSDVNICH